MIITRRSFLVSLLAAPIIIRPGILMPVKKINEPLRWVVTGVDQFGNVVQEIITQGVPGKIPMRKAYHVRML